MLFIVKAQIYNLREHLSREVRPLVLTPPVKSHLNANKADQRSGPTVIKDLIVTALTHELLITINREK